MADQDSVTEWIAAAKQRDKAAVEALYRRFFDRVTGKANRTLAAAPHIPVDGEDVADSVLYRVLRGVEEGKYDALTDRDSLWKLLALITRDQAVANIRREAAAKRGGGRVVSESALESKDDSSNDAAGLAQIAGTMPTPEFLVLMAEQCDRLLALLPDDECRQIARLRLERYTVQEIADKLDCSKATVERIITLIKKVWERQTQ